jgi:hypothetical protein
MVWKTRYGQWNFTQTEFERGMKGDAHNARRPVETGSNPGGQPLATDTPTQFYLGEMQRHQIKQAKTLFFRDLMT